MGIGLRLVRLQVGLQTRFDIVQARFGFNYRICLSFRSDSSIHLARYWLSPSLGLYSGLFNSSKMSDIRLD